MTIKKYVFGTVIAAMMLSTSGPALAGECKTASADGWGLTEQLAKWQATDMLLLSTGNLVTQNDRFSKPEHQCSFTLLGWTCKATAKVCKK